MVTKDNFEGALEATKKSILSVLGWLCSLQNRKWIVLVRLDVTFLNPTANHELEPPLPPTVLDPRKTAPAQPLEFWGHTEM